MTAQPLLELTAGNLRLVLSPSIGGSISRFEAHIDGQPTSLLRLRNSHSENVLEAASFPLVPFVNRIRGGRFMCGELEVELAPNMAGDPSPLHGQGWLHPWSVEDATASTALLAFVHEPGEWPWRYKARQEFSLDRHGLSLRLSCRNTSDSTMPCGLGQHPYFPCGPRTRLATAVTTAWTIDEQVLPVAQVPAEGRFDLRDRLVCGQDLDHGFGGWGGTATLSDPDWAFDLRMSSPNAGFFQLYSPPEGGIFVAEPVTHANAALNAPMAEWQELGIQLLEPGQSTHLDMRLDVLPK
jgi:aldose 1-epimerase